MHGHPEIPCSFHNQYFLPTSQHCLGLLCDLLEVNPFATVESSGRAGMVLLTSTHRISLNVCGEEDMRNVGGPAGNWESHTQHTPMQTHNTHTM